MKKLIFITNIPTPYQIDFFDRLQTKVEVKVIFLKPFEKNRDWTLPKRQWMVFLERDVSWTYFKSVLFKFNPDYILIGGYTIKFAFRLFVLGKMRNKKVAYWLERPFKSKYPKKLLKNIVIGAHLIFAERIYCIGSDAEKFYKKFNKNTTNLPYSIEHSKYISKKNYRERNSLHAIRFLFVGQYIERKGVVPLLDAFMKINPNDATLTFVGSGELLPVIKNIEKKYPQIEEIGFKDPDQLKEIISNFDVLIQPSLHDGWAVTIVEAMVSGIPFISTPFVGAAKEFYSTDDKKMVGFLCKPEPFDIQIAIEKYINNKELLIKHGQNARQVAIDSDAVSKNSVVKFANTLK